MIRQPSSETQSFSSIVLLHQRTTPLLLCIKTALKAGETICFKKNDQICWLTESISMADDAARDAASRLILVANSSAKERDAYLLQRASRTKRVLDTL